MHGSPNPAGAIATIHVVLDKPRALHISTRAMERMKQACGIDLSRGDKMRTHAHRCCFVWAMIDDETLRPEDLAAYITLEKFVEIAEAIEAAQLNLNRRLGRLRGFRPNLN